MSATLTEYRGFLYHLLTKERLYQKPTYTSLRASLFSHAEINV